MATKQAGSNKDTLIRKVTNALVHEDRSHLTGDAADIAENVAKFSLRYSDVGPAGVIAFDTSVEKQMLVHEYRGKETLVILAKAYVNLVTGRRGTTDGESKWILATVPGDIPNMTERLRTRNSGFQADTLENIGSVMNAEYVNAVTTYVADYRGRDGSNMDMLFIVAEGFFGDGVSILNQPMGPSGSPESSAPADVNESDDSAF